MRLKESIPNLILRLRSLGLHSRFQFWPLFATPLPKGQASLGSKGHSTLRQYFCLLAASRGHTQPQNSLPQAPNLLLAPMWPLLQSLLSQSARVQPGAHPRAWAAAKSCSVGVGRSLDAWVLSLWWHQWRTWIHSLIFPLDVFPHMSPFLASS